MGAYGPQPILQTYTAGADLSALQWYIVKLNSSGQVVPVTAITDIPIGVLQNAPTSGQVAEVVVVGGTKVVAGAAIALPAIIGTSATGQATKIVSGTATTVYAIGQADGFAAAAQGDIIPAFINAASPTRAA